MGLLQTAFAASQVMGLPAGLYLTNLWGWHTPFFAIVIVSLLAAAVIVLYMKPLNEHLKLQTDKKAYQHLIHTIRVPSHILAFTLTGLLSMGGFMIMPFGSAFIINNVGIPSEDLPLIYFVTGVVSIFLGPLLGKLSDTIGKMKVFYFGSVLSILMVIIYTNLGITPLYQLILINSVMFVGIFSRMIPSQSLMSAIPDAANRGAFMSVSSSLQSLAGGVGSMVAGSVVIQEASGKILHFDVLGYIMTVIAIVCMVMMFYVNRIVQNKYINQL